MRTVMVAKQKGGVGASTAVRELAVAAAAAGERVVLIDLDAQGTSRSWWNRRTAGMPDDGEPNPGLALPSPPDLPNALDELRRAGVGLVLVDTPPSVHDYLGAVMRLADLILLPTRPTTDDLDALPAILDLVEGSGTPFAFVPTQVPPGRSRLYEDVLPMLAQRGRVAPPLRLRTDFPVAAAEGRTATEVSPRGKGAEEVADLWRFVEAELARLARRKPRIP